MTFPYLRRDHVHVYLNGVATDYRWINDGLIELLSQPSAGTSIKINRQTPVNPIHTLENNRPIPAVLYNELIKQALFRAEEMETEEFLDKITALVDQVETSFNEVKSSTDQAERDIKSEANMAARWSSDPEDAKMIDDGRNPPNHSSYHWSQKALKHSLSARSWANAAQDLVSAANVAFKGIPDGSLLDLGHVSDSFKLFNTDLGKIEIA